MKLTDVVQLARLKAEIEECQWDEVKRLNSAAGVTIDTALAQFSDHFAAAGFAIKEEGKTLTATLEKFVFSLTMDDSVTMGPRCTFTLVPPSILREATLDVHLVRRDIASVVNRVVVGEGDLIQDAIRELKDARAALSLPAPQYEFLVFDKRAVGSFPNSGSNAGRPRFSSFADLLNQYYPQS